ncbi:MAG: 4Fe-4S binding protein [Planctomycetes bacterium]|nr:4Fe-4S binding protein [Planctomycetota bacterium]
MEQRTPVGRARVAAQLALYVALAAHVGAWYLGGRREVGTVSAASVFYLLQVGLVNAGALLVGAALLTTPLLGNAFCGWACHFGALQDFAGWALRKVGLRPLGWHVPARIRALLFAKLFVLNTVAAWFALGKLPRLFVNCGAPEPLFALGTWLTVALDVGVLAILSVWLFGPRAFCRAACPVILVARLGNLAAPLRMKLRGNCIDCGACDRACPMGNPVSRMLKEGGSVAALDCVRCGRCLDACPTGAIGFGTARGGSFAAPAPRRGGAWAALAGGALGIVLHELLFRMRSDGSLAGAWVAHLPNWELFYAFLGLALGVAIHRLLRGGKPCTLSPSRSRSPRAV